MSAYIRSRFGISLTEHDFIVIFNARLDETGTDGRGDFVTVGGAVSLIPKWDRLEAAWQRKLDAKKLDAFHLKEFDQREGQFAGWSDFKCSLFEKGLNKVIDDETVFRLAISIHSLTHSKIKERMRGIKGFHPDSDYSLCLRYLMFHVCEQLTLVDPNCQLSILVEDGPWAAGAGQIYQKIAAMRGPRKPAKHAHRLAGFIALPKGLRSLEAADLIVGREHERLLAGRRPSKGVKVLAAILSEEELESWYVGMMDEKEARRTYAAQRRAGA